MAKRSRLSVLFLLALFSCKGDDTKPGKNSGVDSFCGDESLDSGEDCDDGNLWGGDGCTPECVAEDGILEIEPNDALDDGQRVDVPATIHGGLPAGDRDCFTIALSEGAAVSARLLPNADGLCVEEAVVELWNPEEVRATSGLPSVGSNCAEIDPEIDVWARYLVAGDHQICVGGIMEQVIVAYTLEIEAFDSCTDLPLIPLDPSLDLEGDDIADTCDPDDDNDGVDDDLDNCPEAPNGPVQPFAWDTSVDGFVGLWLVLGPFTGGITPLDCEPSPDSFAGPVDADVAAVLGDVVDGNAWFADFSWPDDNYDLRYTDWFSETDAPREGYSMTWLYAPDQRDAVLAFGADDGVVAWLNGVEVSRISSCQGVGTDAFQVPVTLDMGWNRLLFKVYDGGGGWGQIVRFYADDYYTPMTDLMVSIAGPTEWVDNQGDLDGDGIGDLCDPDPTQ